MRLDPASTRTALASIGLALALSGCESVARPVADGGGGGACTACHGDATRDEPTALDRAAPPRTSGGRDPGAHLAHLHGGAFLGRIACSECHAVPDRTGHADGRVDLAFGDLARSNGVAARYDAASGTCTVWCHGPTLSGGPAASPAWTGSAAVSCGDCHGAPPPGHAASSTQCSACHPGTVDASGNVLVATGLHMNGHVDVASAHPAGWSDPSSHGAAAKQDLAGCATCHGADFAGGTTGVSCNACHGGTAWQTDCTFCHGTPSSTAAYRAAPPLGTRGETLATQRAVGAHQRHLAGGGVGPAAACTECHPAVSSLAHVDGAVRMQFGSAATAGGHAATWNGGNLTCSNACHRDAQPIWTGGSTQAICGTCHGVPPTGHASGDCGTCHTGYTSASVNPALHMNGAVDASGGHPAGWSAKEQHGYQANQAGLAGCRTCHGQDLAGGTVGVSCSQCHAAGWSSTCTFCHGNPSTGRASPPVDSQGRSSRTVTAVGAHDRHASPALAAAIGCASCHPARGDVVTDAAHVDGGPAEVAFSGLGTGTNTYVRVDDANATCTVYCHGAFTGGKAGSTSWTSTAAMTCSSCHPAAPVTGRHPAAFSKHSSLSCGTCHGSGYSSTGVVAATHVNGAIEKDAALNWQTSPKSCDPACHSRESW